MTLTNHLKLRHLAHSEACLGGLSEKKKKVWSQLCLKDRILKIKDKEILLSPELHIVGNTLDSKNVLSIFVVGPPAPIYIIINYNSSMYHQAFVCPSLLLLLILWVLVFPPLTKQTSTATEGLVQATIIVTHCLLLVLVVYIQVRWF